MSKTPITILITQRQHDFVRAQMARLGLPQSEVMRRLLDDCVDAHLAAERAEAQRRPVKGSR